MIILNFASSIISLPLLVTLLASKATGQDNDCNLNKPVLIRNQWSGLILEAKNATTVTIERFNKTESQQWYFRLSKYIGVFNIINRSTGLALDVNPQGNEVIGDSPYAHNLTLTSDADSDSQRWIVNSDGTIVNAALDDGGEAWGINIPSADYGEGSYVVVLPLYNELSDNKRFILEFEL